MVNCSKSQIRYDQNRLTILKIFFVLLETFDEDDAPPPLETLSGDEVRCEESDNETQVPIVDTNEILRQELAGEENLEILKHLTQAIQVRT